MISILRFAPARLFTSLVSFNNRKSAFLLLGLLCWAVGSTVYAADPVRYRGGIRNGEAKVRLSNKQLKQIVVSLKAKTGFQELEFNEEGFMVLGDRARVKGGSAAARELLVSAIDGPKSLVLENHDRSPKVAFARIAESQIYQSMVTGNRIEVQAIEIDFSDFLALRGDGEATASFDIAIILLHELGHGVFDLRDAVKGEDEPGECERYVNQVRRELGLPERMRYSAVTSRRSIASMREAISWAELPFVRSTHKAGEVKQEMFRLGWEAAKVSEAKVHTLADAPTGLTARGRGTSADHP